ncbi:MAG: 2-hydroxyacyl-CoA dehydratase family protein [Actinobacteria bacterium]|nr:2-hydroxyacyl-CoA dehydratase family protein [Actinomycetota bacterium]
MIPTPVLREGDNAFERTLNILDMIYKFPDHISDEEVEGVANYVNPDIRNTVLGLFEIGSARDLEVLFVKKVIDILREAQRAKAEGKKVVFVPFTFPPEIIFAFENLFPVCTEVIAGLAVTVLAGQGERFWDFAMGIGLPDSLCTANTMTVGSFLMGPGLKPDAIVSNSPGSCNPNAKIHAFAADYLGIPQFILEKPVDDSERGRELYHKYLCDLIKNLEEFAGEELSEQRLREVVLKSSRAADLYNEFWELRKARPCPVHNIFNANILFLRSQLWGRDEAIELLGKMVDISKERLRTGEYTAPKEIARVYVSYIFALFDLHGFFPWMEKRGISILGDILAIHFFPPVDTSSKESMLRWLSEVTFDYPMTRQMGASEISLKWLEDISFAVKDLGADCCVYIGHHACKHTAGSLSFLRRELMKQTKVPTLTLVGDSFDKRHTPMSIIQEEIELFVDKVVSKRKGPKRRKRASTPG